MTERWCGVREKRIIVLHAAQLHPDLLHNRLRRFDLALAARTDLRFHGHPFCTEEAYRDAV